MVKKTNSTFIENSLTTHPAFQYLEADWPVIPAAGKRPLVCWKPYQTRRPTREEWIHWLRRWPTCNTALVCGAVSGKVSVDVDGPDGLLFVARMAGGLPRGPLVLTPRGWRWICFSPEHPLKTWTTSGPGWSVTILGEKSLAILPPGRHPAGGLYEWASGKSPDQISPGPFPTGLFRSSEPKRSVADNGICRSTCPPVQSSSHTNNIPSGRRNITLFRMASGWVNGQAPPTEVRRRLDVLNRRCAPPLTGAELDSIARSVERYRSSPST